MWMSSFDDLRQSFIAPILPHCVLNWYSGIGTMTVLLRAKQRGVLPAAGPVIAAMLVWERRISPRLRAHVIRSVGEDVR